MLGSVHSFGLTNEFENLFQTNSSLGDRLQNHIKSIFTGSIFTFIIF